MRRLRLLMRDILLTGATMLALTGGFAHAASTNDEMFANAALRELHKLVIASAQYERAAKDSDRIGCRDAYDSMQKAAHEALTNMHQMSFAPIDALDRVSVSAAGQQFGTNVLMTLGLICCRTCRSGHHWAEN